MKQAGGSVSAVIGAAMRQLREERGMTTSQVAVAMGKSPNAGANIGRWERGETTPGIDQVFGYLSSVGADFQSLHNALNPLEADPQLEAMLVQLRSLANRDRGKSAAAQSSSTE